MRVGGQGHAPAALPHKKALVSITQNVSGHRDQTRRVSIRKMSKALKYYHVILRRFGPDAV